MLINTIKTIKNKTLNEPFFGHAAAAPIDASQSTGKEAAKYMRFAKMLLLSCAWLNA